MSLNFSLDLRNARLQAIINELDGGVDSVTTGAMMHFYTEPRPSAGVDITTEIFVASCALSEPCATISGGVLTFDPISEDVSADADEDIGWCRIVDSDGEWVMDLGCGIKDSGEQIIFNTLTARIGGVIKILSGSLTEGNI